jgi:hypothetical protein
MYGDPMIRFGEVWYNPKMKELCELQITLFYNVFDRSGAYVLWGQDYNIAIFTSEYEMLESGWVYIGDL